ncbi:UDP-glucuronosyltransferase [Virgibacillus sp. NKC19-16]|uniref:MGDG synthase family glycosyltransferase n=1 Tax=Virgibacillus salidurans TaxID=2831673 RepID=UPI001F175064|nr:UDP-glucuronosyltransferase [Virgibacillus sp. NKC19-16]UJL45321.1 UDP-glucuronosyltransferase [Virgibacillus sp. NKC19-16]
MKTSPSNKQRDVLFLPFMQIPTGHHHVADALMDNLQQLNQNMKCQKVDILAYSFGRIERVISSTYLTAIKSLPDAYHWIYDRLAYKKVTKRKRQFLYEILFSYFFKRLIKENRSKILFFTHALPSNIASVLKQKGKLEAITVNVYTDYFVNRIWGLEGIDYHIVPSTLVKLFLMRNGVKEDRIFITGIPVHTAFHKKAERRTDQKNISVLVTGGSLGVGAMDKLIPTNPSSEYLHYYVLCGKNVGLYQKLITKRNPNVTPLPYIENKEEMNHIYDQVDAVMTKPGGVTVSESLMKRKVLFIYDALPGPEKVNVDQLKQLELVIPLSVQEDTVENQIMAYFSDKDRQTRFEEKIDDYHQSLEKKTMNEILAEIISITKH